MTERFHAFVFDYSTGESLWREYTRETLLSEVATHALSRFYGPLLSVHRRGEMVMITESTRISPGVRSSDMIKRAATCGLLPAEVLHVQAAWADWWSRYGASVRIDASSTPVCAA